MKTKLPNTRTEQGTALLVAMFLCLILSVTIAGYLLHSRQQNYLSMRSQSWNMTIAISEAGIEDAMQQLNANSTNLSANGWVQSGSTYTMTRELDSKTKYTVVINAANPITPYITSQAYMSAPQLAGLSSLMPSAVLATIGANLTESINSEVLSRAIKVKTGRDGLFLRAMVAKRTIDMNGNDILTDSFNSADSRYNINGRYPAGVNSKLLDNGDVASNFSIVNTINVGNANIYGRVSVGPGGTITVGANGGVGTRLWQTFNNGIQPGYFTDDMNFTFPTVQLPYTSGLTPTSGSVTTTNFTYSTSSNVVTSATYPFPVPASGVQTNITYTTTTVQPSPVPYGMITNVLTIDASSPSYPEAGTYVGTVTQKGNKYYFSKITGINYIVPNYNYTWINSTTATNFTVSTQDYQYILQGGAADLPPVDYYVDSMDKASILVKGNARLVVKGNVKQSGQDQVVIASDGKLEMWVGGTSVELTGQGVMNKNGYAQNFLLWCADTVTDMKYAGNGEFIGCIVAPNAKVVLSGGGNSVQDFVGALIADTITMNGHYKFHYDEALRDLIKGGRYKITEWNEVAASQDVSVAH